MVYFDSFLCKVLDDPTNWIARPYSPLKGGLLPLFHFLKNETVSCYRNAHWFEGQLPFVACDFTSHLQAHFQDDFETQAYNPQRFAHQFGFDQGVLGHFSIPVLPATMALLAFKILQYIFGQERQRLKYIKKCILTQIYQHNSISL